MDDRETTIEMMKRLLAAIKTKDDGTEPHIAIPALNFTLGYVLGQAIEGEVDNIKLSEIYSNVISEVDYARRTASAIGATYDAIEKAKQ